MKDAFVSVVTSILVFACTGPTVAQEIELFPELELELELKETEQKKGILEREPPFTACSKRSITR